MGKTIGRALVGSLLALPLMVGVTAGTASAASVADYKCGYSRLGDAYYNHCGPGWMVSITVEFVAPWEDDRSICVAQGVTNLSTHGGLQGSGMIDFAYADGGGC